MTNQNTNTASTAPVAADTAPQEIVDAYRVWEEAQEQLHAAQAESDNAAEALEAATKKFEMKTFVLGGEYIQVRNRGGVIYVTKLKSAPQDWLKNSREKKVIEAAKKMLAEKGIHLEGFTDKANDPAQDAVDATVGEGEQETSHTSSSRKEVVL